MPMGIPFRGPPCRGSVEDSSVRSLLGLGARVPRRQVHPALRQQRGRSPLQPISPRCPTSCNRG
eukprot:13491100-Alexandrium_andersonii.AAC.1